MNTGFLLAENLERNSNLELRRKSKRVSPRGIEQVKCRERMNIMVLHRVFIPGRSRVLANLDERQKNHSVSKSTAGKLTLYNRICGYDKF